MPFFENPSIPRSEAEHHLHHGNSVNAVPCCDLVLTIRLSACEHKSFRRSLSLSLSAFPRRMKFSLGTKIVVVELGWTDGIRMIDGPEVDTRCSNNISTILTLCFIHPYVLILNYCTCIPCFRHVTRPSDINKWIHHFFFLFFFFPVPLPPPPPIPSPTLSSEFDFWLFLLLLLLLLLF